MSEFVELEIGLDRGIDDTCVVDLMLRDPGDPAVKTVAHEVLATFARDPLLELKRRRDLDEHGKQLFSALLADADAKHLFLTALESGKPLRVVLRIGPQVLHLHDFCWEALSDPETGKRLLDTAEIAFSRFLASSDSGPVRLGSRRDARALVVVADPKPDERYPLEPVPDGTERQVVEALARINATALEGSATFEAIEAALAANPVDVLCLVCHGSRGKSDSVLYLETADGAVAPVQGREFAKSLARLEQPPGLVVLVSCESAAAAQERTMASDSGAVAAIGPALLSLSRVVAVVAMQDIVAQETAMSFVSAFADELCEHGNVERAATSARGAIRNRADWWMPALFSRLRTGELWYQPGFRVEDDEQKLWDSLIANIEERAVTAILGPELLDLVVGSTSTLAHNALVRYFKARLGSAAATIPDAEVERRLPIGAAISDDLAQTAQFMTVMDEEPVARRHLRRALEAQIKGRFGAKLDESARMELIDLVSAAGKIAREQSSPNPYTVLAQLPVCFYITTSPDRILEDALVDAGKEPMSQIFSWRSSDGSPRQSRNGLTSYDERSPQRPFLWYLLGRFDSPDSLVLTEDNYLDFHAALAANRTWTATATDPTIEADRNNLNVIHHAVLRAMGVDALMFVGFRLDDWSFRVLFRSIVDLQRHDLRGRKNRSAIAVQLAPSETRIRNPEIARDYLQGYFRKAGIGSDVHIYWGTSEEFLRELDERIRGG
jgi:hypothetical protein